MMNYNKYSSDMSRGFPTFLFFFLGTSMLLLLLHLLSEPIERARVLIDTLLRVSPRSAASVARQAGVQPANLSRARKEGGGGRLSEALQASLLNALGWTGGVPDTDLVHRWFIRDAKGILATEWLLTEKLSGRAQLTALASADHLEKSVWIGKLSNKGALCSISFLGQETYAETVRKAIEGQASSKPFPRQVTVPKRIFDSVLRGTISDSDLSALINGTNTVKELTRSVDDLTSQLSAVGLTPEIHVILMEKWLAGVAEREPDILETKLSGLERLDLSSGSVFPKAFTEEQMRRFVKKLAEQQWPPM